MIKKRLPLTLIELIIVTILIVLSLGVIGFNIQAALKKQRFETELVLILKELALAQDLMLILQVDADVLFAAKDNQITMGIKTVSPLTGKWHRVAEKSQKILTTIDRISLDYQTIDRTSNEKLRLPFFSNGSKMVHGILTIQSGNNIKRLCLKGYPQLMRYQADAELLSACFDPQLGIDLQAITTMTLNQLFESKAIGHEKELETPSS